MSVFSKTQDIADFLINNKSRKMKIKRLTAKDGTVTRFFTLSGSDITGRVSKKIEQLSSDNVVSWFTPETGEPSYMVHPAGTGPAEDVSEFTLD